MATLAPSARRARGAFVRNVVAGVLVIILLAIALGLSTSRIPRSAALPLLVAVPVFVILGFVVASGPRACLALLVAAAILGLNTRSVGGGEYGVRAIDLFWLALVGWTLVIRGREGPMRGRLVGQRQVGLWLAALLISLYPVAVYARGDLGHAFVAWARLAQTVSLVWLVPYALRKIEDIEFLLRVVEVALAAEIVHAIVRSGLAGHLGGRIAGGGGPDTTGLLAALLIVVAIQAPVPRHQGLRIVLVALGATGLLMTKSVGSLAAAGVMLGIFGVSSWATRRTVPHRALLTPVRLLFLLLAVAVVASTIRPGSLPGGSTFNSSTTFHRTVLATAGLELFREHPIVGVGWSRGPVEIGSNRIDQRLRDIFGSGLRPDFLPSKSPVSVHNAYIEILAEAGIVGFLCFLALLIAAISGIRRVLRSVAHEPRLLVCASCAVVLLVGVLVWWNDNALFGAQPETVLAATLLGMLAAIPRVEARATPGVAESVGIT